MTSLIMTQKTDAQGKVIYDPVVDIITGKKTQTRRIIKKGERLEIVDGLPTLYHESGRIKWQVGMTRAIKPSRTGNQVFYRGTQYNINLAHVNKQTLRTETYLQIVTGKHLITRP